MVFSEGGENWEKYLPITAQSTKVSSDESNFPYYYDLSEADVTFWDNVQSDGGDLRVTSDEAGATQLPLEVVSIQRLKDDAVAYYTFDENTGSTLGDSVGSNDGTISGATWTTGKIGSGLSFDGVDDRVTFGDVDVGTSFSVSTWFKSDVTHTFYNQWDSTPSERKFLFRLNAGDVEFYVRNEDNTNQTLVSTSSGVYADDSWHHAVAIYDSGTMSLYVDGSFVGSDSTSIRLSARPTYMGWTNGTYTAGELDECGVWSRALSAKEVELLYNNSNGRQYADFTGTGEAHFKDSTDSASNKTYYLWYRNSGSAESQPAVTDTYGRNAVWSAYEAVWHFNTDPSGTAPQLTDVTGNGYDGTTEGSMTSGDVVSGQVGKAWQFDGTDDGVTITGTIGTALSSADVTITSWARAVATNGNVFIWELGNANDDRAHNYYNGDNIRGLVETNGQAGGGTGTTAIGDTFHKVDFLFDNTNTNWDLYLDDTAELTDESASGHLGQTTNQDMTFGYFRSSGAPYQPGIIDEIRVYVGALSAGWRSTEYNMQSSNGTFWSTGTSQDAATANNVLFFGGGV